MTAAEFLANCKGNWSPAPPALPGAVPALARESGLSLPPDYLEFLSLCNGGDGFLSVQPCYLRLWRAEEVVCNNRDYQMPEYVPGFFGFGDAGGEEFFAFDTRCARPWPVVSIPFVVYVAVTRASSNPVVSYVKRVCACEVPPSRFLYEAELLKRPERKRKKGLTKVVLPPRPVPDAEYGPAPPGGYVASRTSIVFHLADCGSAKKIADGTLIRYATRAEAIQARKHPCLRCRP